MTERISSDKAGQLALPKAGRDALRLSRGVWIYTSGQALSAEEVRDTIRDSREARSRAYHTASE